MGFRRTAPAGSSREYNTRSQGNSATVFHERRQGPALGRGGSGVRAKTRLEADRAELARFVDATFRYADDATAAALRTFAEGSNEVLASVRVPLNGAGL